MSTDAELKTRIESSAALRRARETLLSEVSFRAGPSARFDPFTIIAIISIIVQLIAVCQKRRNPQQLIADIRNARALPLLRTRRLRKKLDELWAEHCDGSIADCEDNILYTSVLDLAENADNAEIQEIMTLAAQQAP
jgi:uncharacterized membrane protein